MRVVALLFVLAASTASAQPAPAGEPGSPTSGSPASESPTSEAPAGEPAASPHDPAVPTSEPAAPSSEPAVPVRQLFVPTNMSPPEPEHEPLIRDCFPAYAEGHLLVGGRTGPEYVPRAIITRWSIGLRLCTKADIQAGIVFDKDIDTEFGSPDYEARGFEARVLL
jgi:hypothetical protein